MYIIKAGQQSLGHFLVLLLYTDVRILMFPIAIFNKVLSNKDLKKSSINVTQGHQPIRQYINKVAAILQCFSAASNMITAVDRPIKLLANREKVDVRVPFLQSALGERTNSNTVGKYEKRDQWKLIRWANVTA